MGGSATTLAILLVITLIISLPIEYYLDKKYEDKPLGIVHFYSTKLNIVIVAAIYWFFTK